VGAKSANHVAMRSARKRRAGKEKPKTTSRIRSGAPGGAQRVTSLPLPFRKKRRKRKRKKKEAPSARRSDRPRGSRSLKRGETGGRISGTQEERKGKEKKKGSTRLAYGTVVRRNGKSNTFLSWKKERESGLQSGDREENRLLSYPGREERGGPEKKGQTHHFTEHLPERERSKNRIVIPIFPPEGKKGEGAISRMRPGLTGSASKEGEKKGKFRRHDSHESLILDLSLKKKKKKPPFGDLLPSRERESPRHDRADAFSKKARK